MWWTITQISQNRLPGRVRAPAVRGFLRFAWICLDPLDRRWLVALDFFATHVKRNGWSGPDFTCSAIFVPITEILRDFFFPGKPILITNSPNSPHVRNFGKFETQKHLQHCGHQLGSKQPKIIKTQPVQFSSTGASDCCSEREKLQGKLLQRVQTGIAREPHVRPCRYRVSRGETPMVLSLFLPRTWKRSFPRQGSVWFVWDQNDQHLHLGVFGPPTSRKQLFTRKAGVCWWRCLRDVGKSDQIFLQFITNQLAPKKTS